MEIKTQDSLDFIKQVWETPVIQILDEKETAGGVKCCAATEGAHFTNTDALQKNPS